jgi:hypothetical protein
VTNFRLLSPTQIATAHLAISLLAAGLIALLIFYIWYPWPFWEMLGGSDIFWLILVVDIICGPLLTLVLWKPLKSERELWVDMTLIACLQVGALIYGVYIVAIVRPVYLVFEVDRIRVVSASEVKEKELKNAPQHLAALSWTGPKLISVRDPRTSDELLESVELSLAGQEPSLRPGWWQDYAEKSPEMIAKAQPLRLLEEANPEQKHILDAAVRNSGLSASELLWLPVTSAKSLEWIVLIDKTTGIPRGFAPIDGFL